MLEAVTSIRSERRIPGEFGQGTNEGKGEVVEADRHLCIATADQVDAAFEHISTLRYLQPTQLDGKCSGLTLTAYSAGHTLGGAVWKLRSPSSGTLLIALDWNHTRERHIDGTALITASLSSAVTPSGPTSSGGGIADAIRRPDVLITSMARASYTNTRRKDRDAAMLDLIHNTIRSGHSVLIPVDASSRLLELLVLLDQHWAFAYPHVRFPLCLVSATGREVVERARTLMEWMTSEWARTNTSQAQTVAEEGTEAPPAPKRQRNQRNNNNNNAAQPASPLDFQYLRIFSNLAAMDEVVSPSDAKVVLAWPPSLTHGPSRKLFTRMAGNEKDVVILTQHGQAESLGRELYEMWESKQELSARWGRGKVGNAVQMNETMELEVHSKVPLQGEELESHLEAQRLVNERAAHQKALLARSTRRLEADEDEATDDSGSSGDESEEEEVVMEVEEGSDGRGGKLVTKRGAAVKEEDEGMATSEISFDIYLKGKASRATTFFGTSTERASGRYKTGIRFRMFPVVEKKRRVDTFGETLDISKWLSRKRQLEALGGEAVEGDSKASQDEIARRRQVQKEEEAARKRKEEPPSKFVTDAVQVNLACRLEFIDMEGLGDGKALKIIVPQLEPRRVILVESCNASDRETLKRQFGAVRGMTTDIRLPIQGERIEIGEFTFNFTVNLGEDVLGGLRFSNFQDYQVALLKARINYRAESSIAMLEAADSRSSTVRDGSEGNSQTQVKSEEEEEEQGDLATQQAITSSSELAEIAAEEQKAVPLAEQPTTLFIGDLKLSSLKQSLAVVSNPSIPSEFIGQGTLICGSGAFGGNTSQQDVVTVRKENEGQIVIEGNVSRNFYSVRDAVYALHAQVTG